MRAACGTESGTEIPAEDVVSGFGMFIRQSLVEINRKALIYIWPCGQNPGQGERKGLCTQGSKRKRHLQYMMHRRGHPPAGISVETGVVHMDSKSR